MENKKYKIGIVGLGPVGLTLAVHFKEAGCEVALCDMIKEKMDIIKDEGVRLEGKITKSSYFDNIYTSLSELLNNDLDILICSVKAQHVEAMLDEFHNIKNKNLCVISAQNGIDVEKRFSTVFNKSQILKMVVNYAGGMISPNVVNVTFFNPPNYIASIDDSKQETAKWLSEVLSNVKLTTKYVDSFTIKSKTWEKAILNSALSALCAISRLTMKKAMANSHTLEIVEQTIIEGVEVAKAEGIKFDDNFVKFCMKYLGNAGDHFPSLAVDLMNNKKTEIEYLNGKIVEYGKKHHIQTPMNLTLTNIVKAISQH